jgi:hypothetical protein
MGKYPYDENDAIDYMRGGMRESSHQLIEGWVE